jgi:hypothetical protein
VRIASIIRKIAMMMEAVRTCETSAYLNKNTRRCMPESCHLHTRYRKNLKSKKKDVYLCAFALRDAFQKTHYR